MPRQTRVVRFSRIGGPEVLSFVRETLAPPASGDVQLRIEAIGLNRAEAAFRADQYIESPSLPARIGYEATGIIEAVGPGVGDFRAGDAVCVLPMFSMNRYGVYAQHANVPAAALVHRPDGLDALDAAALWMAHMTAWGALVDIAGLCAGDTVLITAASSSVGLAAIQIARAVGARPVAMTRDAGKREALLAHGAETVVISGAADCAQALRAATGDGVRLVFDPVAGPAITPLADALAPGGLLLVYGNLGGQAEHTPFPFYAAVGKGLSMRGYLVFEILRDPERCARGRRFIEHQLRTGTLSPVIDRVFDFDDIVNAHRYLESNQQIGKVVVRVNG
ncbi:zinc-dependent alcohol dehydrogenase family protein [Nitrogeniibacter aestuarii]|uniref:zinc-dependent alcohol dehydrogenase family protein n=1 Tax=Nitrogeniibacter aestuarii TaxID=2815343 RepID=UPI001E4C8917|nr:zinc-dependent alcohol dehydrogenase family protein [Nitrogeniibacter aestuarii]